MNDAFDYNKLLVEHEFDSSLPVVSDHRCEVHAGKFLNPDDTEYHAEVRVTFLSTSVTTVVTVSRRYVGGDRRFHGMSERRSAPMSIEYLNSIIQKIRDNSDWGHIRYS